MSTRDAKTTAGIPKWVLAQRYDSLRGRDQRRRAIKKKWRGHECMTLGRCPTKERRQVETVLRRFGLVPITRGVPEGRGYVAAVFFLPWLDRVRFAYILKDSHRVNLRYRGSGTRDEFLDAAEEVPPGLCVKVFLHVGEGYAEREVALQRQGGIRELSTDPDHEVWLNGTCGDNDFLTMTTEQRRANGKRRAERERNDPLLAAKMNLVRKEVLKAHHERVRTDIEFGTRIRQIRSQNLKRVHERARVDPILGEKMRKMRSEQGRKNVESGHLARIQSAGGRKGGKKSGPAAIANMIRRLADLRSTHDPAFLDEFRFPIVVRPAGFDKNAARYGFDIAEDAIVVPLAKNPFMQSQGKTSQWIIGALRLGVCRFADIVEMRDAMFSGDRRYAGPANARQGLSRESAGGMFAICCPETGRVLRGYGQDEDRLTYRLGVGWLRGRVRSSGPLAYWKAP